jgi:hypothetical protein
VIPSAIGRKIMIRGYPEQLPTGLNAKHNMVGKETINKRLIGSISSGLYQLWELWQFYILHQTPKIGIRDCDEIKAQDQTRAVSRRNLEGNL